MIGSRGAERQRSGTGKSNGRVLVVVAQAARSTPSIHSSKLPIGATKAVLHCLCSA
jgi:hypothetical protein